MTDYLNDEQRAQLLRGINPLRVGKRDNLSHLEAYDVRAHLTRIFGFGRWSADVTDVTQLFESLHQVPILDQNRKPTGKMRDACSTGYRATLRLTVCAPDGTVLATYTECATGDATNFPINKRADAHDFAIKTAESQALKRCAINLGDQFGLSLYNKGATKPLVARVLFGQPEEKQGEDATAHITTQLAPEQPAEHPETPAPGPSEGSAPAQEKRQQVAAEVAEKALVDDLRHRALNIPEGEPPLRYLPKLLIEAGKAGVRKSLVPDRDDNYVSFDALVQAEVAAAAVRERAS